MRSKTVGCGLTTLVLGFIIISWLCSGITMFGYEMRQMGDYGGDSYYHDNSQVDQEVWLRLVIPGPLRSSCYSAELATCKAADGALRSTAGDNTTDFSSGLILGGSSILAIVVALIFRLILGRMDRSQEGAYDATSRPNAA